MKFRVLNQSHHLCKFCLVQDLISPGLANSVSSTYWDLKMTLYTVLIWLLKLSKKYVHMFIFSIFPYFLLPAWRMLPNLEHSSYPQLPLSYCLGNQLNSLQTNSRGRCFTYMECIYETLFKIWIARVTAPTARVTG